MVYGTLIFMEKTTVYLRPDSKRALKAKARRTGCTEAELIREAIDRSVIDEEELLPSSIGTVSDGSEPAGSAKRRLREDWRNALQKGRS